MTKKIVYIGVAAALICVLTIFPSIPIGVGGYVHLGDSLIIAFSFLLGSLSIPAAALGSALADLFNGFASYSLATFFIKGAMAAVCVIAFGRLRGASKLSFVLAPLLCEAVMIGGYFLYEWPLLGITAALGNIVFSLGQAASSALLGTIFVFILDKRGIRAKLLPEYKNKK